MASTVPERTGLRDRANTEARIRVAARERFAEVGYERASVRSIAERAGVNAASIIKFFGSKEELFADVTDLRHLMQDNVEEAARGDLHAFIGGALRVWEEPSSTPLVGLARSASTHPAAAEAFRKVLADSYVERLAAVIPAGADPVDADRARGDARRRAAILGAVMFGVGHTRSVVGLDELQDLDEVVQLLAPVMRQLMRLDLLPSD